MVRTRKLSLKYRRSYTYVQVLLPHDHRELLLWSPFLLLLLPTDFRREIQEPHSGATTQGVRLCRHIPIPRRLHPVLARPVMGRVGVSMEVCARDCYHGYRRDHTHCFCIVRGLRRSRGAAAPYASVPKLLLGSGLYSAWPRSKVCFIAESFRILLKLYQHLLCHGGHMARDGSSALHR